MAQRDCMHYVVKDGKLLCKLCPHRCVIEDGQVGKCRVRRREGDRLVPLTYAEVTSVHLDPIEKKPLYHFYPGSLVLSLGTWGCNMRCDFCQNWSISQLQVPTQRLEPEQAVELALSREGNIGLAYTYNEPFIWYEYMYDTAQLAHERGLKNVVVTNGFINPEPLEELLPCLDALNIDVKAMSDEFYRRLCGGRVRWVLRAAELAAQHVHVEITNLVIPGENDSEESVRELVDWVAEALGPDTPLHFSRYHPDYKLTAPATPPETLSGAYGMARERLNYVYVGNIAMPETQDTVCPSCGATLISRHGFGARMVDLAGGQCGKCHTAVNVISENGG